MGFVTTGVQLLQDGSGSHGYPRCGLVALIVLQTPACAGTGWSIPARGAMPESREAGCSWAMCFTCMCGACCRPDGAGWLDPAPDAARHGLADSLLVRHAASLPHVGQLTSSHNCCCETAVAKGNCSSCRPGHPAAQGWHDCSTQVGNWKVDQPAGRIPAPGLGCLRNLCSTHHGKCKDLMM